MLNYSCAAKLGMIDSTFGFFSMVLRKSPVRHSIPRIGALRLAAALLPGAIAALGTLRARRG